MNRRRIALETLTFDVALWPRLMRDEARVAQLADVLRAGVELPPIKIQKGTTLVLGGWHTAQACRVLGQCDYFVEIVDVPEAERLLFAYYEDMAAALPYSDADTRSVAERLYRQRSNGTGHPPNVAHIARDLHRSERTVQDWLKELIERDRQRQERERHARALLVAMLAEGAQISQRRIAELLGVSQMTVNNDRKSALAVHSIADDQIVSLARSLLAETAGRGSSDAERQAASDWLLEQLNPDAMATARRLRALTNVLTWTVPWYRQLGELKTHDLAGCLDSRDPVVQQKRDAVFATFIEIQKAFTEIQRRMA